MENTKKPIEKSIKAFEKMQDIKENIESASHRIYGNVLTLMGIIVAIFSLISINSRIFDGQTISPSYIIAMNLSLTFCIAVMLGMILFLINKGRGKGFAIIYGIVLLILGIASVIFCSKILKNRPYRRKAVSSVLNWMPLLLF